MKTLAKVGMGIALVLAIGAPTYAADGGNPKKGKHFYKKLCKSCHSKGQAAGELTPMSKTMGQWDRFFIRNKHKVKPDVFDNISEQKLKDIQQFLYDHAADSDQPQTCG
ncbi:c-type cytochrome [Shewanella gelidii]|uniref:Periplasmic monoheme cytochrome c n=1 Tax=Shewanella gelidii TaxID=1642821 RepID=A0A917N9Z1_9GAMM|nr:cytochrome c [Shewanella gelidii]MCL1097597.1 cytochrome c [Shewanella gelidii]GGI80311.1 periplasmic monoheme cytochrome c [Shewanella gelidii]